MRLPKIKTVLLTPLILAGIFGMLFAPSVIFYPTETNPCENSSVDWSLPQIPQVSLPQIQSTIPSQGGELAQVNTEDTLAQASSPSSPSGSKGITYAEQAAQLDRDAKNWMMERYLQQLERRRLVWKIDTWLQQHGSPMYGCGEYYVQNQERTGIPATLSVGIAEAESTSGKRTYNSHTRECPGESYNAWGMIAPEFRGGFGSWENGIRANFDWLMKHHSHGGTRPPQTMHDCPGYCEGNGTMATVDDVQAAINRLDASCVH